METEYTRISSDGYLEIRVKLSKGTLSSSGKTLVVASSRGNFPAEGLYNGKPVTVGFNAYVRKD